MTEADTLLTLQEMDFAILRAKKTLEKIPEQDRIMVIRGKRKEVSKKADQIADLRQNCELEITKFQYEASLLRDKIASMQTQLDETSDYRVVAGLSKDMEGCVKRQERIGFEISNLYDRLEKIEEVEKQVTETQAKFAAQEESLTSTYRATVTQIQEEIAKTQAKRNELALDLAEDLLARYEKLRAAKGGIGAGELISKHCSVCNVEFHEGEWLRIRKGPTIGTCPACNRLLVVRKEA